MTKKRKANSPLQPVGPTPPRVDVAREEIRKLREEVSDLRLQLRAMEYQHDSLQQRSKLVCLIFSGPAISAATAQGNVIALIKDLLLINMEFELH